MNKLHQQPVGIWKQGTEALCPVWRCTGPETRGGSDG